MAIIRYRYGQEGVDVHYHLRHPKSFDEVFGSEHVPYNSINSLETLPEMDGADYHHIPIGNRTLTYAFEDTIVNGVLRRVKRGPFRG